MAELRNYQTRAAPNAGSRADTSIDEVVATMAANKFGSAVVMKDGKVVGIFTTVDACRAFADLLRVNLPTRVAAPAPR